MCFKRKRKTKAEVVIGKHWPQTTSHGVRCDSGAGAVVRDADELKRIFLAS